MTLAMPAFWVWSQKTFQMMKYTSWKHYKSLRIKLSVKCINGKKESNPIFAYSHLSYYKKRKWLRDSNFSGNFLPLNGTLVVVFHFWWVWVLHILLMPICMSCGVLIAKGSVCNSCLKQRSLSTLSAWGSISVLLPKTRPVSITQDGCQVSNTAFR